jgi:hypothetical protein
VTEHAPTAPRSESPRTARDGRSTATKSRSGRHRIAAALAVPVLALATSGCYSGFGATTNMQATQNTGNGVRATIGAMLIDNATLVRGPEGSSSGTLIMAISNRGKEDDQLVSVTIGGAEATTEPAGPVAVPPNGIVRFGFNADHWVNTYALDAPISGYVPVQLTFAKAGVLSISVLTVEPTGYYAGVTPNPATPPPAPLS